MTRSERDGPASRRGVVAGEDGARSARSDGACRQGAGTTTPAVSAAASRLDGLARENRRLAGTRDHGAAAGDRHHRRRGDLGRGWARLWQQPDGGPGVRVPMALSTRA